MGDRRQPGKDGSFWGMGRAREERTLLSAAQAVTAGRRKMAEGHSAADATSRFGDASQPRAVAIAAAFVLSLYCGLALAYRDSIPLFATAEEAASLHYAAFVRAEGRLPRPTADEVPGADHQPPLVYTIAAPLLGASRLDGATASEALLAATRPEAASGGAASVPVSRRALAQELAGLELLRGVSLAFGLLAVIFTFAAVWRASQDARLALLAGGLLAFNPEFLFTSATFSNDTATVAVGAAALWIFVRSLEDPEVGPSRRDYAALGFVGALGLLTKLSTLPVVLATLVALLATDRRRAGARSLDAAIAGAVLLIVAGPYLAWSSEYRGGPLGLPALLGALGDAPRPEAFGGRLSYWVTVYWDHTFESYWAGFGGLPGGVPEWVYLAFFTFTWTGCLGFAAGRHAEPLDPLGSHALRRYLVGAIGAVVLAHFACNALFAVPDGRYLFAGAPHIAFLLALGWLRLLATERRILFIALCVVGALLALDLLCLRSVLLPAVAALP